MQKSIAIFVIILIVIGVIASIWIAMAYWRTKFTTELLIYRQTARRPRPVEVSRYTAGPPTTTPVERIEQPYRAGRRQNKARDIPVTGPLVMTRDPANDNRTRMVLVRDTSPPRPPIHTTPTATTPTLVRAPIQQQREQLSSQPSCRAPSSEPATTEQASPNAQPAGGWSSEGVNTGKSSECSSGGNAGDRSNNTENGNGNPGSTSEWGSPAPQTQSQSHGEWGGGGSNGTSW